jgi:hypothetical protein
MQNETSKSHLEAQLKSTRPFILIPTPAENSTQPSIFMWVRLSERGEINTGAPPSPTPVPPQLVRRMAHRT